MGFLDELKASFSFKKDKDIYLSGFLKSNVALKSHFQQCFKQPITINSDWYDSLFMALVASDVSVDTATKIIDIYKGKLSRSQITQDQYKSLLVETISEFYGDFPIDVMLSATGPTVVLIVGVNGSGKTTSIAKLAYKYQQEGLKVAVVAGDTFRAGAIEQLRNWAEKLNVRFIGSLTHKDPSAVLVEAARIAKAENIDILLCDTAGRLQNKVNLMHELAKMVKVLDREIPNAPHAIWLVLDATTGQNGLAQASVFMEAAQVGGIILTKMDGTSKGGVILTIKDHTGIGVIFIGLGENKEDIRPFDKEAYLYSMFEGE